MTQDELARARAALDTWAADVAALPVGIDADRLDEADNEAFERAAVAHGTTAEHMAAVQQMRSLEEGLAVRQAWKQKGGKG